MARRNKTVDLLPEIFRTDTNKQLLAATLDQVTQEPVLLRTQGYVGRRVGPGVDPANNYVTEPDATRADYQLEPAVTFQKNNSNQTEDLITYPGILDALQVQGGLTNKQDRLFTSQFYAWDPMLDFDKFANYSQYYWLAGGPDSVDVAATEVPIINDFTVTRTTNSYQFSSIGGNNPTMVLARGGNYKFKVDQPGHRFYIQTAPGINGRLPETPNISSRDVYGVFNNGTDDGEVEFRVPVATAQNFFYNMTQIQSVDLAAKTLKFSEINNRPLTEFLADYPKGIDGIFELRNRTVVFLNRILDAEEGGWQYITDEGVTDIDDLATRYSVWLINYVDRDGVTYIELESIRPIPIHTKFNFMYGAEFNNVFYYKDSSGLLDREPLLTAAKTTLYYQDSTDPRIFGEIKLVDSISSEVLDINSIVGQTTYTSPDGVVFTNGLKIQFRGNVIPSSFQDREFYVEGVGTGPGIADRVGFINGEAYFGSWHYYNNQKMTGSEHSDSVFHEYIYDTIDESLANPAAGEPDSGAISGSPVPSNYTETGIKLIPVKELITPETYTKSEENTYDSSPFDTLEYDASLNSPLLPDYITQNRADRSRNAWSRSNRWFHIDVINYAAQRNGIVVDLDNNKRAKRPIIEFRNNVRLWNNGTQAKSPVNIVDFAETDAFSNISGTTGYGIDGYTFINGTRVIFAADIDPLVRNRIYEVQFIDPTGTGTKVIDLVPTADSLPAMFETVLSLNGLMQQGTTFWFDGVTWTQAQQKTRINQPPLFDVYDEMGRSFGNRSVYPSSTFQGSKLFGYAESNSVLIDPILGFSLEYLNIENVGDILFENYFYTDSFIYVENRTSIDVQVSSGFARQYTDRTSFANQIGWQPAIAPSKSRQNLRFIYDGQPLRLGVPVVQESVLPTVQIFIEGVFIDPTRYTVDITQNNTSITLDSSVAQGSIIEVQIISDTVSNVGYYTIPTNLEQNPLNLNSARFTLGTVRTHYESIAQNLKALDGPLNGANNTRDLGNIVPYGSIIVQNSSPLTLAGTFLRKERFDIFPALRFNAVEYEKFKAILLDLATKGDFVNLTPTQILDDILTTISIGKTEKFPFYWSDMIPNGGSYIENNYTISFIDTGTFDTVYSYDFTTSNYRGLLVYLNGDILTLNYDYTVPEDSATVIITKPFKIGDTVTIREYETTNGSFVPNTPTKMGLYPAWRPELVLDDNYSEPTLVIRGHDGSITRAFGDFRDQILLEFELRIFNNLKIQSEVPMVLADVMPGQFRRTDWSLSEINEILLTDFLSWAGQNRLDYTQQTYRSTDPFTYNYSQSASRINGTPLLGGWRGIYQNFYDTVSPNTTPWECLGFSQRPEWWNEVYSDGPYTDGNLVLWRDLELGYIADPLNPRIDPRYARPGLTRVIPAAGEGALVDPLKSVVGNYDAASFRRSWAFGDGGPVEATWRASSSWPFAVMRLFALTQPAKFFSLMVDRDRYIRDVNIDQYVWDLRYRLDATNIFPIYGSGTSKASYINWIVDYNQRTGIDSEAELKEILQNIDVRLTWRLGGFSDKSYLKIYSERSTPSGNNNSLLLPDESYQLLLYKNQPFGDFNYSSVIVSITNNGYAVSGYDLDKNYFEILSSRALGTNETISAGGTSVQVPNEYTNNIVRVPYGFVFVNRAALCDFLLSYGRLLEDRGLSLTSQENGYTINWRQMAQEFLYWSNQGWSTGSVINLNPGAKTLVVTRENSVVNSLFPSRAGSRILNQNQTAVKPSSVNITRIDNEFKISSLTSETLNLLNMQFTAYEHVMVLDNRSIFGDLLYDSVTGARQSRVLVSGWISGDWDGTINAPGFVINQETVPEWNPRSRYSKGDIVLFKNEYWSANDILSPVENFNYADWTKSDYQDIKVGLLPNAATVSNQLSQAYSVTDANLENEVSIFSYGLVGFRPRQYMQALNLDDVSQVNLYNQFLKSKGTKPSAELFSFADIGKEIAEYDLFEYWAVLKGTYGATANRNFIELRLDQAQLPSDPSTVSIVQPQQPTQANQNILLENVWKTSYRLTSTNIFPTTNVESAKTLPNAGYADLEDVDLTVFDLVSSNELNDNLDKIGIGTTIWVAKVDTYSWNVYRISKIPGQITRIQDNLDGSALVTFSQPHNLAREQNIIIKEFADDVDGAYRVSNVVGVNTIIIEYEFTGTETVLSGNGLCFILQSSRVGQQSNIPQLPYATELTPGVRVWVDDDGTGHWAVVEKSEPFDSDSDVLPRTPVVLGRYGASVSQGFFNLTCLVGAPGYNPSGLPIPPGAIYAYVRTDQDVYEQAALLTVLATGTRGLGNAIDIGDQTWAVVGASESHNDVGYAITVFGRPGSNAFDIRQLLLPPDQDFGPHSFGHSVTMSQNERWMFISSPGINRVYAYLQVPIQAQSVEYITDGATSVFAYSDNIVIDSAHPEQLTVVLNNVILIYNVDYTVDAENITLVVTPEAERTLLISRRQSVQLDQTLNTGVASTGGSGSGAIFTVNNVRGVYTVNLSAPGIDYIVGDVLTLDQDDVATADTAPPAPISTAFVSNIGSSIVVASTTGLLTGMVVSGTGFNSGQYIEAITGPTTLTMSAAPESTPLGDLTFSHDIKVKVNAVDGNGSITEYLATGVGVISNNIFDLERYLYTAKNIYAFTVRVNNVLQRPYLDYDFNSDSSLYDFSIVFNTVPAEGAVITVNSETYYEYLTPIECSTSASGDRFGESISTTSDGNMIIVGAPMANNEQGQSCVFSRSVERFQVSDPAVTEYRPVRSIEDPGHVAVKLNGVYLLNTQDNVGGTFTVDVTNPLDPFVEISVPLALGDIIEIETNQFDLVEILTAQTPLDEAQFGLKVDQCVNDCSLYISAPFDSSIKTRAGLVEFYQNQSRVYGSIISTIANPVLVPGDHIRINNYFVEISGESFSDLINDINSASIPNVIASPTPNVVFVGDGVTRVFDVGSIYSQASSYQTRVLIDDSVQSPSAYTYNASTRQIIFSAAPPERTTITIVSGRVMISVKNFDASIPLNRLTVLPGTGTVYDDAGFDAYIQQQTIASPVPQTEAEFGKGLFISDDTSTLMIGAPGGSMIRPLTFDSGTTYFDFESTQFADATVQSGAVYSFDALPSANPSATNPLQFVFGQQFTDDDISSLDRFGETVDYTTGVLLIGAPGSDLGDSSLADFGKVIQFSNPTLAPAWQVIRRQSAAVDVSRINSIFMYDLTSNSVLQYLDYFDPLQGKLLGVLDQNIDYVGAVDPAAYNNGNSNNYGSRWAQEAVGRIWWDVSNIRYLNPGQNDINYTSRRWGQLFPGSQVEVYQWTVNTVPPANYQGPGQPKSISNYTIATSLDQQGFLTTQYYYWVKGITEINTDVGKTLSVSTIARYIEDPASSGIPYVALLSSNGLALYNSLDSVVANDTVLHVEFDVTENSDAIHEEYQLIGEGEPGDFLSPVLYRKLLDSLAGSTVSGAPVPDPGLTVSEKYGVAFSPRQTMFVDRFGALKNYITESNRILAQYPISEMRTLEILNSSDPEPSQSSNTWDKRVLDLEELGYQDLYEVPLGYRYLVASDSRNDGYWTIYNITTASARDQTRILTLNRVQNYDTRRYWSRVDWYRPGFNSSLRTAAEVPNVANLDTLSVPNGSAVKITENGQGRWEIYLSENGSWNRVGLEQGTIQLSSTLYDYTLGRFGFDAEVFDSQYFDQAPLTETRKIVESINQELFVGELESFRNRLLILLFNYILEEQIAPRWLTKTSLIDVSHTLRELLPFQIYRADNQDFVLDYINEVKPYHSQIREFNLKYQGNDNAGFDITDFDLPSYYDALSRSFISPVLDNTGSLSVTSSVPNTAPIWQRFPYNQWYQNYTLGIKQVDVIDGGSGYISPPTITVTGDAVREAVMEARINSAGRVVEIIVVDSGVGYTSTPIITFSSEGGSGAKAVARMGNDLVRNFDISIKYDRYQYQSPIPDWQAGVFYANGDRVMYANRVWQANGIPLSGVQSDEFDPSQWLQVPAGDLSGVERTMGYYQPRADMPGRDLALLISGVDYPGVQVVAPTFGQNTGFDVGNYDINTFDNISFGAEGKPTYDPAILDAVYESAFTDTYLGTRPTDINVDGGAFVDTFESHAPEELVPGITYDTLDFRVFTAPGADWSGTGHGFEVGQVNQVYDPTITSIFDFSTSAVKFPVKVLFYNQTQGIAYPDATGFSVSWPAYSAEISASSVAINPGDLLVAKVFGVGGGNIGYINTWPNGDLIVSGVSAFMKYPFASISDLVIFKNGEILDPSQYTYINSGDGNTGITFNTPLTQDDRITTVAYSTNISGIIPAPSWSTPTTEFFVSSGQQIYTITNSLSGTNPANLIVTKNGIVARPSEGARYESDGSTLTYQLPNKGGYDLNLVSDNDVSIYVGNVPQILGVDFVVDPAASSTFRTITLLATPALGTEILISVRTQAQYWIVGDQLILQSSQGLIASVGDVIAVTTFHDTSEQGLLTQVFVGPSTTGIVVTESYDETLFDQGIVSGASGSFDYQIGTLVKINDFDIGRTVTNPERLWVSLDGRYLFPNDGYVVEGSIVRLIGPAINASQRVVIKSMTDSVVPDTLNFRIFQDMRGSQWTYRITDETTTILTQACSATDDILYVEDASRLQAPDLANGIFGMITVEGERITYRTRDVANNTVSGLRRGVAGTAPAPHAQFRYVYSISPGNLLMPAYQDRDLISNFLADGSQKVFETDYSIDSDDSAEYGDAVLVYVGGILQTSGYVVHHVDPIRVEFDTAPTAGYQVSIRVRSGLSWYQPGDFTASNGQPLQNTNTPAARFLRGLT